MSQLVESREPLFEERWYAGTYLVSGVFFFDGTGITPSDISHSIDPLYERTKKQKRRLWPRGLCGYYIIPIFTAVSFDDEVVRFVRTRMAFRWAIWPEPALYRSVANSAERRNDYGMQGAAYYPYVSLLIAAGLSIAAKTAGHNFPSTVNGREIQKGA
jgi:hypothetical protein